MTRTVLFKYIHMPSTVQFIEELFKPQDMYSEKATKEVFYKVKQ